MGHNITVVDPILCVNMEKLEIKVQVKEGSVCRGFSTYSIFHVLGFFHGYLNYFCFHPFFPTRSYVTLIKAIGLDSDSGMSSTTASVPLQNYARPNKQVLNFMALCNALISY